MVELAKVLTLDRRHALRPVAIQSADFWVKVVEMLQQNWAVINLPSSVIAAPANCLPTLGQSTKPGRPPLAAYPTHGAKAWRGSIC